MNIQEDHVHVAVQVPPNTVWLRWCRYLKGAESGISERISGAGGIFVRGEF